MLSYLWYIATLQNTMNKTRIVHDEEMPLSQMLSYLWYIATLQNTMNKTRIVHDEEMPLSHAIIPMVQSNVSEYDHISI